jgi:NAD(P)-dependent dehydrogenase (short-subunit alcohol dehydrogenase family)
MNTDEIYASITPRYPEFRGQVAIVTGSSRGIGKGIALRLGREGMKVVINSRTADTVEATTAELRGLGIDALAVTADLGQTAGVDRLFEETLRTYGTVDLLVNNAAALKRSDIFTVDEAMLDLQLASNIRGPYMCSKRAAEIMREKRAGSIIHISSVGGARAHWKGEPYDMTKGALDALTRVMALELGEYGVRVNAIAPGPIYTRGPYPPEGDWVEQYINRVPLRRYGAPIEIGAAVAFLHSADAAFITGHILYIDGGLMAQLTPNGQPI